MKAISHRTYGTPDVLTLERVDRPVAKDDEVLVRVHAAAASVGDVHVLTGKPYLIRLAGFGVLEPKNSILGMAVAGKVEAVGKNVTDFQPGDEVFGELRAGTFAEYVSAPAELLAPKPASLTFEQAAAVPWGVTALQGLRDVGEIQPGQKVLINGASGGVGTFAVQIAKSLGAEVTAVCSTRNIEWVRALGADEVIDYTAADFTDDGPRFDLMLDMIGNRSTSDCKSVLNPKGVYVSCAGEGGDWVGPLLWLGRVLLSGVFASQKMTTFIVTPNRKDLITLGELVEKGEVTPVIDRHYPLAEVPEALRYVGEGHAQGQTVIQVSE